LFADASVADISAFAGHVIGGRYVLQQRVLGNGSFGVIVLASDNQGETMSAYCTTASRV
jgi:hypothetical protein